MATVNTFPLETTPLATALQTINFLLYRTTSASSLVIGTGTKVFTVEADKDWQPGAFIVVVSDADPANYMYGTVVSYAGTTLTTTITVVGGSGTHADWNIMIAGAQGGPGLTGPAAWMAPVAWQTATAYTVGPPASVVTQGGETYVCLISHTSGTFATDLAASRWVKVAAKGADGLGTGDVVGPASSLNGSIAVYGDTTGKLLADAAVVLSAYAKTILDDADAIAARATLGLVIGTNVQAPATTLAGYGITNARGQGKETIFIPASAMTSRTTNGAASGSTEMATNKNMNKTLDFDTTTQEFAQFDVWFPKSWNLGTVTFQPEFSQLTTAAGGVVFGLAGVAQSDGDALDAAFGTAQTSTKTAGTANTTYIGPESAAITIAGTPTVGDRVQFQINRTVADGSDTLAQDARLRGIRLFFTTNAATDA